MTLKKFIVSTIAIVALFATSASAAYMHTGTLKMGMSSSQVMSLQQTLNANGFLVSTVGAGSPGMESMYFGAKTKAAVMAYQAAKGLGADGVVGPMTGTSLAALVGGNVSFPAGCTSAAGYSTTTGQPCNTGATFPVGCTSAAGYSPVTGQSCNPSTPNTNTGSLSGTVGSIDYSLTAGLSNEEVGEDDSDVKVAGLELDLDDSDSDVQITAVKLNFDRGTASASTDFEDVAEEVTVWLGTTKVASLDGDEFNDDNDFEKTVTLSNAVVRKGDAEDLYVAISAVGNLDSGDVGDTWTVDFTQVRFIDAQGAVTTEDPTESAVTFSFESFATANNAELVASLSDSDEINKSHLINVDATDDTDNVELLAFELDADDSDSDVVVDEIPVLVTVSTATNVDALITSIDLYQGSEKVASENIPSSAGTTEAITFDDLDITVDAGDMEEFTVKANFISVADAMTEGDGIKVELTVGSIDAEDESGEALTVTGSANGEYSYVYDVGFNIELVSASETKTVTSETSGTGDQGQFVIKYKVTAYDGDIYIDNTCVEDNDDSEVATATSYEITNPSSNSTNCVVTATGSTTHADYANSFLVEEGESETFTLTVNATASADAFAQVQLEAIGWDDAAGGDDNVFTYGLPGDFKTDPLFLNLF